MHKEKRLTVYILAYYFSEKDDKYYSKLEIRVVCRDF